MTQKKGVEMMVFTPTPNIQMMVFTPTPNIPTPNIP